MNIHSGIPPSEKNLSHKLFLDLIKILDILHSIINRTYVMQCMVDIKDAFSFCSFLFLPL